MAQSATQPSKFTVVTSNKGPKTTDITNIVGSLVLLTVPSDDVKEIQNNPTLVAWQKLKDTGAIMGLENFAIEDTTLGPTGKDGKTLEVASYIKAIVEAIVETGGDLYAVMTGLAPRGNFVYTSTIGVCINGMRVLIECAMKCKIISRDGEGRIDPFIDPISYTLTIRLEDGTEHVLKLDQEVSNPDGRSIVSQPERRDDLHPRIHALKVLKLILEMGFEQFIAQFLDESLTF